MTTFEVILGVPHPSDGRAAVARGGRPAKEALSTDRAPTSPLYAQGIRVGETIYLSGMVGGGSLADVVEVGILVSVRMTAWVASVGRRA